MTKPAALFDRVEAEPPLGKLGCFRDLLLGFMRMALERYAREEFPVPEGVQFVQIDRKTGLRASGGDPKATVFQSFREGTAPLEFAPTSQANGRPALPLRLD